MDKIRVMLVDDHNLVRAGIHSLLQNLADIEIVVGTDSGVEAICLVEIHKPDIILMDISLQDLNGLEVTRQVKAAYPDIKVIILSMYASEEYVLQALQTGASGYLLKDARLGELEMAIRAVANGGAYLSPSISHHIIDAYIKRVDVKTRDSQDDIPSGKTLTPRQKEILCLIAEGLTTKEIAQKLNLSAKTIGAHRTTIMKELNIHDVATLVRYAVREGLVLQS